jgi:hypothetical protein
MRKTIPNLTITVNCESDIEQVSSNLQIQDMVFRNLILGIREAQQKRRKTADIIELNLSGNLVSVPQENWKTSLESAEKYFVRQEKYEICSAIQQLINSLDSYGTRRSYKTTPKSDRSDIGNEEHFKTSQEN